ncbi:MAG: 2'-5' RNA ligase family protein [Marinifilaceae bacterium]
MIYAIECSFNQEADQYIRKLWDELNNREISNFMINSNSTPHIAFAVFDELNMEIVEDILNDFTSSQPKIELEVSSIGTFPTTEGVVFLAPKVTSELLDAHKKLHEALQASSLYKKHWDYYQPEHWIPHCTMAINVSEAETFKALKYLKSEFNPLKITLERMIVVEYENEKIVNEPLSFNLK